MGRPWHNYCVYYPARLARLGLLLLTASLLLCCAGPGSVRTDAAGLPASPPSQASGEPGEPGETAQPASMPTGQVRTTEAPPAGTPTAGPYVPTVKDRYRYFEKIVAVAQSLAAREDQLWIGTVTGTIVEIDPQTGAVKRSLSLASGKSPGAGMPMADPIYEIAFEGDYLWLQAGFFEESMGTPRLYALDPDSGEVVHEWDLNSPEWMEGYERILSGESFGVSPGKIWIDGHIVNARTFQVTQVGMPGDPIFAYDGGDWMWMNGELGGACDDVLLVNVSDPEQEWCEDDWPFFTHAADGIHPMGMGSPMAFGGDRLWMAGEQPSAGPNGSPTSVLEAYPADIERAMETTGPLLSVPAPEESSVLQLLVARGYLWALDTYGDNKPGYLFQLDTQTGEVLSSLDLVGEDGRAAGDLPVDMAAQGNSLWVLTSRQLLRIELP